MNFKSLSKLVGSFIIQKRVNMSYIADEIDREYRIKPYYKNKKKRQTCNKEFKECEYIKICTSII